MIQKPHKKNIIKNPAIKKIHTKMVILLFDFADDFLLKVGEGVAMNWNCSAE